MLEALRFWKLALVVLTSMSLVCLFSREASAAAEPMDKEKIDKVVQSARDLANSGDVVSLEQYLGRAGSLLRNDQIAAFRVTAYGAVFDKLFNAAKDGIAQKEVDAFKHVLKALKIVTQSRPSAPALVSLPGQKEIEDSASRHLSDYLALLGKQDASTRKSLINYVTMAALNAEFNGMKVDMPVSLRNLKSIAPGQSYWPEKDAHFASAKQLVGTGSISSVEGLLSQVDDYVDREVADNLRAEVYINALNGELARSSHHLKEGQFEQGLNALEKGAALLERHATL